MTCCLTQNIEICENEAMSIHKANLTHFNFVNFMSIKSTEMSFVDLWRGGGITLSNNTHTHTQIDKRQKNTEGMLQFGSKVGFKLSFKCKHFKLVN